MPGRQVQCKTCLAVTAVPDGVLPGSLTWCSCCTQDHDHGIAAASCPGDGGIGHPGEPCSHPSPRACTVVTPAGEDCPGGHCGAGVNGCTVCRPVIHFVVAGSPAGR